MTVFNLMVEYQNHNPGKHFFDRDTLRFFGERVSEMRVLKNVAHKIGYDGAVHTCYVLSSRQHNAPGGPKRVYHYFDATTFEPVGNSLV